MSGQIIVIEINMKLCMVYGFELGPLNLGYWNIQTFKWTIPVNNEWSVSS